MISAHLGALALVVGDILIRAVRLRLLVGDAWTRGLFSAVRINAYGDAASAVTPGRLGGDPARFFALRQAGVATPPAVVALGVEHVVDLSLAILVGLSVTVSSHRHVPLTLLEFGGKILFAALRQHRAL